AAPAHAAVIFSSNGRYDGQGDNDQDQVEFGSRHGFLLRDQEEQPNDDREDDQAQIRSDRAQACLVQGRQDQIAVSANRPNCAAVMAAFSSGVKISCETWGLTGNWQRYEEATIRQRRPADPTDPGDAADLSIM